jgi:G:T-mismatch repair DNA endonuclease (very short patch repair protein)
MRPCIYYSRSLQKFVTPEEKLPEKGDIRYKDHIISMHDGRKWRRTCDVCWTQATKSGYCYTHDPENLSLPNTSVSKIACEFLDKLEQELQCSIRHCHLDADAGVCGQEFRIPDTDFKVDGYIEKDRIIIEFLGSYWHGNEAIVNPQAFNTTTNKYHAETYNQTFQRMKTIADLGYTIWYIWESTYKQIRKDPTVKIRDHLTVFDPNNIPHIDTSHIDPTLINKKKRTFHEMTTTETITDTLIDTTTTTIIAHHHHIAV